MNSANRRAVMEFLHITRTFLIIWSSLSVSAMAAGNINLRPRQQINADYVAYRFRGNSSKPDFFKLLERDGHSLLVGARNAVYNLSLPGLTVQQKLEWVSSDSDVQMCRNKGKSEDDCHNYIRVLVKQSTGRVLICGTNAFNPACRQYIITEDGRYGVERQFDGKGICPYDPRHNSTATFVRASGREDIYAGTVADLASGDPLICRSPLDGTAPLLRTRRYDLKCLNEPDFVSSFADAEHVYFWLREKAEELGRGTAGRVARVCRGDAGGPPTQDSWAASWTSFAKARLNCSLPGDAPFVFDELQATSGPVRGADGDELVYAVLSTPANAVRMSALCAFRMADVARVFRRGAFKAQETPTSLWLPIDQRHVPQPRPGSCVENSKTLSAEVVNFIHKNPLMDEPVPNFFDQPLFVDASLRTEFTQIAVQPQVQAVSGRRYDVLFVGTSDGRVLKLLNTLEGREASSVVVEAVRVFHSAEPVENLLVDAASGRLVAVSRGEVRSLPLFYCANRTSCTSCVALQDPYCAWDAAARACVGRNDGHWIDGEYVQSIVTGRSESCPEGELDPELYAVNELYPQQIATVGASSLAIYSAESMTIAIIVTLILASTFGFLLGFRLSRWKTASDAASSSSGSDYDTHLTGRSCLVKHDAASKMHRHADFLYGASPGKVIVADPAQQHQLHGVVMTLPDGSSTLSRSTNVGATKTEKNLLTLNNGTLPKDYKVKKVYV